jgi:aminopeptidase N
MFPSADDPYFKAIINLTLIYPKGANAFSNSYPEKEGNFECVLLS